jgi:hypothetical protein
LIAAALITNRAYNLAEKFYMPGYQCVSPLEHLCEIGERIKAQIFILMCINFPQSGSEVTSVRAVSPVAGVEKSDLTAEIRRCGPRRMLGHTMQWERFRPNHSGRQPGNRAAGLSRPVK